MFDKKSRYANEEIYQATDSRGRTVPVVSSPAKKEQELRGYHQRKQGQRVDHLAYKYLDNASGFWRICEMNEVMLPETLSDQAEIAIPNKSK